MRATLLGGFGVLLLAGAGALACGPWFPWQLLDNRTATLRDLPVDSFFFQATHLLPRPDPALHDQKPAQSGAQTGGGSAGQAACTALVYPAESSTADAALLDRYKAGASAFGRGDTAAAAGAFQGALSFATGPTTHAVCAAYMLGRSLARSGDLDGARSAFLRVRDLASRGAPDTLGLAVASFGEQARLMLGRSGLVVGITPPAEPAAPTPERLPDLHDAVTLYSQQAAYGSQSGIDSLQEIAEALFSAQPGAQLWFDAAVADPRIRQLLVAYALADTPATDVSGGDADHPLLGSLDSKPVTARLLDRLAPAFDPAADPRDAGRLAAVAYIAGRYDLAARFAAAPQDPLSAWIRAKLSLQHDDLAASARAFDAAARLSASHPGAIGETSDRLRAEPAVIAVGQGDFERALRLLYGFGPAYWGDVAYVAERLVTTGALQRFVADLPPPSPLPPPDAIDAALLYPWPPGQSDRDGFRPDLAIRELLARRLMREGRWKDARASFVLPSSRAAAERYADAVARLNAAFWRTDRARGAWDAALLARGSGMALFGTEVKPDEHVTDGAYDSGYGPNHAPAGAYVTPPETQRYAATAPRPDRRFHYRFTAAAEAERAATLLPPRSQAYAAVLCSGALWRAGAGDGTGAARLYRRYVANGALLPNGMVFGASCPAPRFGDAARLRWSLPLQRIGWSLSRHWHGLMRRLGARSAAHARNVPA